MTLPPLPPAPREVPPPLERRIETRGMVLVFWTYVFLVCGLSFIFVGIYTWNYTSQISGAVLTALGLGTLWIRRRNASDVPQLLREGTWTTGRVTGLVPGPKRRTVRYEFTANGAAHAGLFEEEKPWADEFAEGADVAVLFDPAAPAKNLPLAPHQVELACQLWKLTPENTEDPEGRERKP